MSLSHPSTPSRLAWAPQPGAVAPRDVWCALTSLAQDFTRHCGLRCAVSIDIDRELPAPEGAHADAICRIFQEMLTNVARHAQATDVLIRVCAKPGDLTLLVQDNGRGAPPSAFEGFDAHGVSAMRALADQHGGWLQVRSGPGQGTQLILSTPLGHAVLTGASSASSAQERAASTRRDPLSHPHTRSTP